MQSIFSDFSKDFYMKIYIFFLAPKLSIGYENFLSKRKNLFYNILVLNGYLVPLLRCLFKINPIFGAPKNMSTKNRQLNRLNIQPCLKAAEPSTLFCCWFDQEAETKEIPGWLAVQI